MIIDFLSLFSLVFPIWWPLESRGPWVIAHLALRRARPCSVALYIDPNAGHGTTPSIQSISGLSVTTLRMIIIIIYKIKCHPTPPVSTPQDFLRQTARSTDRTPRLVSPSAPCSTTQCVALTAGLTATATVWQLRHAVAVMSHWSVVAPVPPISWILVVSCEMDLYVGLSLLI